MDPLSIENVAVYWNFSLNETKKEDQYVNLSDPNLNSFSYLIFIFYTNILLVVN